MKSVWVPQQNIVTLHISREHIWAVFIWVIRLTKFAPLRLACLGIVGEEKARRLDTIYNSQDEWTTKVCISLPCSRYTYHARLLLFNFSLFFTGYIFFSTNFYAIFFVVFSSYFMFFCCRWSTVETETFSSILISTVQSK